MKFNLKYIRVALYVFAVYFVSTPAYASYLCSYQRQERVTISVFDSATQPFVVIRSEKLQGPVTASAFDHFKEQNKIVLRGDLPSPWLAGSEYEIRIDLYSPSGEIKYKGPSESHAVPIPMTCRKVGP